LGGKKERLAAPKRISRPARAKKGNTFLLEKRKKEGHGRSSEGGLFKPDPGAKVSRSKERKWFLRKKESVRTALIQEVSLSFRQTGKKLGTSTEKKKLL